LYLLTSRRIKILRTEQPTNDLLALQADIFGPLDERSHASCRLDVLTYCQFVIIVALALQENN